MLSPSEENSWPVVIFLANYLGPLKKQLRSSSLPPPTHLPDTVGAYKESPYTLKEILF